MSDTSIPENALSVFVDALDKANVRVAQQFPGDSTRRQPVHVVYGGAHLFKADTATRLGVLARKVLEQHAPDADTFALRFARSSWNVAHSQVRNAGRSNAATPSFCAIAAPT